MRYMEHKLNQLEVALWAIEEFGPDKLFVDTFHQDMKEIHKIRVTNLHEPEVKFDVRKEDMERLHCLLNKYYILRKYKRARKMA